MIDRTDKTILKILQGEARTPNADIARKVDLAPSAVAERIRKLKESGLIRRFRTELDPDQLDMGLLAFVFVRTDEMAGAQRVGPELLKIPHVLEVYNVAGEDCYLIKVRAESTNSLGKMLREQVGSIKAVISTRTTIVMETYKENGLLPLDHVPEKAKRCKK